LAKQLIIEEELKRRGVRIEYTMAEYPDTPEGSLMKNIKASIAEYERLKISERVVRGRRLKVEAGSVLVYGRPPYGYSVKQSGTMTSLEICELEAKVVRLIFTWYTKGDGEGGPMTIGTITKRLTELQIPTYIDLHPVKNLKVRGHGEWYRASVHRILGCQTYTGLWHYGKIDQRNGHTVPRPKDGLPSVEVPAIISPEQWQAAQKRLAYNRKNHGRTPKYEYLMARRIRCHRCGGTAAGSSTRKGETRRAYYSCYRSASGAVKCSQRSYFNVKQVDAAVWDWVKSFLIDPARLLDGLSSHHAKQQALRQPLCDRLGVVGDLISDRQAQMERLLDLYMMGDIAKDMLLERKKRLEAELAVLESEKANLTSQINEQVVTEEQVHEIKAFAEQIAEGLEVAESDFAARRRIIELLNVQGSIDIEDGERVVYLQCVLGESNVCISSMSMSGSS
jgi:site-specific DNA recombinase